MTSHFSPGRADRPSSRRRFIGRTSALAAALVLGPSFLAACGNDSGQSRPARQAGDATGKLRISNWPEYVADGFVAAFQSATGLVVDYEEDFDDDEDWFSTHQEALARKEDIGADLVIPSQFMATKLKDLGWLNQISESRWPNKKNLRRDLLGVNVDPGRKFSAPYMSGMVGLAYNRAATNRDITEVADMWDPAFKGKVSLFTDLRDGLGMIMLSQGSSLDDPTTRTVQKAVDLVKAQKDSGQILRFTGNDYADDLTSGKVVIAQAYSGDVIALQKENPDLRFVVPAAGGTTFLDNMVIPYTTENQAAAEEWINYVYDRANYAKLVAYTQYVPVLSDMTDELNKINKNLAENPLINPPQATLDKLKHWPAMTDQQSREFTDAYQAVTR